MFCSFVINVCSFPHSSGTIPLPPPFEVKDKWKALGCHEKRRVSVSTRRTMVTYVFLRPNIPSSFQSHVRHPAFACCDLAEMLCARYFGSSDDAHCAVRMRRRWWLASEVCQQTADGENRCCCCPENVLILDIYFLYWNWIIQLTGNLARDNSQDNGSNWWQHRDH